MNSSSGLPGFLDRYAGWIVALLVLLASILFVELTQMQPEYDAYGWLVWGHQALHLDLNTNGAPSWKPLPFLFTFPYALAGSAQPWLWMVTSTAGAFSAPVFAGRIVYRLTGPTGGRPYARIAAAVFAGVGILGLVGFWPLVLIASSDPLVVALCLAAIDCHLSNRRRLAFVLLVLAALGRPEVWPFVGLYAVWCWRKVPASRVPVTVGILAIPLLWFGISALTAKTWLRAGDVALGTASALHHHVLSGVLSRFGGLYEWPMWLAAAVGIGFAVVRRDRAVLGLAAAAVAWAAIEIAFAFHGWPAEGRYMAEPAAVMVVIAGTGVGRLLASAPTVSAPVRWVEFAAVLVLLGALAPVARQRADVLRVEVNQRQVAGLKIDRLASVIEQVGGPNRILGCGTVVSIVGYQSTLAWELGLNVGYIGHKPSKAIKRGYPIVLFEPHRFGWEVRPIHMLRGDRAQCDHLRAHTQFGRAV